MPGLLETLATRAPIDGGTVRPVQQSTLGNISRGELRAYEPTLMDRLRYAAIDALTPVFGGDARKANAYYRDKVQPTAEFLPGIGDAMAAGEAADAFKQGNYGTGTLLGIAAAAGLVPGVGDVAQKGIKKGIKAYHGSPHSFDKFSLDKIGTGEGAQAYGHGLYFAENEKVANQYKNAVSAKHHGMGSGPDFAQTALDLRGGDYEKAARYIESNLQNPNLDPRELADLQDAYSLLSQGKTAHGSMYEVNINADPEQFLDWDKPLSEQHDNARDAINRVGRDIEPYGLDKITDDMRGNDLARLLQDPQGIKRLRDQGIPGIKYLDQGSRGAGNGSRNYVVFDDSMVEILKKYGLAGLALMGGGGAMANQTVQSQREGF